jgi:hypothetical protein
MTDKVTEDRLDASEEEEQSMTETSETSANTAVEEQVN